MSKNGGPAFPCLYVKHAPGEVGNNVAVKEYGEGVTVRDYFAAKAMQEVYAASIAEFSRSNLDAEKFLAQVTKASFAIADAMLKARNE